MSKNDLTIAELKQLISTITFFQLGARTKELKTIKTKLKNQLKEMESKLNYLKKNATPELKKFVNNMMSSKI